VRFARGTNTTNELKGYLIRLADPPLAEDLLQEVFIKAMREGEKFCAFGNPRAWLFQVARNTLPR
jgi:RNA polymerase sigma-70 factor, ECF subfamily